MRFVQWSDTFDGLCKQFKLPVSRQRIAVAIVEHGGVGATPSSIIRNQINNDPDKRDAPIIRAWLAKERDYNEKLQW